MTTQFRWLRRCLVVLGTLCAMAVVAVAVNEWQSGKASLGAETSAGPASGVLRRRRPRRNAPLR